MQNKSDKVSAKGTQSKDPQLREFMAYLWVYWCLAKRASRQIAPTTSKEVKKVCCEIPFKVGEPKELGEEFAGYSAARNALWLRPQRGSRDLDLHFDVNYEDFFGEERTLLLNIHHFVGTKDRKKWQGRKGYALYALNEQQKDTLKAIQDGGEARDVPYRGAVVIARDLEMKPSVFWIGIREDKDIPFLAPERRARRLRYPEGFFQRAQKADQHWSWWQQYDWRQQFANLLSERAEKFEEFCGDIRKEIEKHDGLRSVFPRNIQESVNKQEEGRRIISVEALCPSGMKDADTALRVRIKDGMTDDVKRDGRCDLLCWTNLSYEDAIDVLAPAVDGAGPTRIGHCVIVTPEEIAAWLAVFPWVWSKYFWREYDFRVLHDDPDLLKEVFVTNEISRQVLEDPSPTLIHPALRDVKLAGQNIALVGRHGAGKTTGLYHLLRPHARDALVVVLKPRCGQPSWNVLTAMIKDLLSHGQQHIIFVIDDLEKGLPITDDTTLPKLLALVDGFQARGTPLQSTVLVSLLSVQRPAVDGANYLPLRFTSILLDDPDQEFLRTVVCSYGTRVGWSSTGFWLGIFMRETASRYEGSLGTMVAKVCSYGGNLPMGDPVGDRMTEYRAALRSLVGTGTHDTDVEVIKLLALFHACNAEEVPVSFLKECARGFLGMPQKVFSVVLSRLRESGWVSRYGDVVDCRGPQFRFTHWGVLDSNEFGFREFARDFVAWVVRSGWRIDRALCLPLFYYGAGLLHDYGMCEEAIAVLRSFLTTWPSDVERPRHMGLCLLALFRTKQGKLPEYLDDVRMILRGCDDPGELLDHVAIQFGYCWRKGENCETDEFLLRAALFHFLPPTEGWELFEEFLFGADSVVGVEVAVGVLEKLVWWVDPVVGRRILDRLEGSQALEDGLRARLVSARSCLDSRKP